METESQESKHFSISSNSTSYSTAYSLVKTRRWNIDSEAEIYTC